MSDTTGQASLGADVTTQELNVTNKTTFRDRAFLAAYAIAVGVATAGWLYAIMRAALKFAGWLLG
ncbi:hypothetical protein I3J27_21320 [Bradyrhizobium xenonodulans]|uniref:Uncharacterized protein n=1 Tax=Bradyrhizobium xenonodulans TaxID=2736875 RepID=A0ABY7MBF5_9BRAD|nr:hypothetical protein [Bradyrhizobium xenonodulans]WBL75576.1 hypothetical protein I3J27_21320 [Bradyrhizobium xenonodulans]